VQDTGVFGKWSGTFCALEIELFKGTVPSLFGTSLAVFNREAV